MNGFDSFKYGTGINIFQFECCIFDNSCNQARKMGNPGMRFPENFASSWEIFTNFLKKNFEMKFLKKIFEVLW